MDFSWESIESTCGEYDFSPWDGLLATLTAVGVRPYWIIGYGNQCYPPVNGSAPNACNTDECVAAYARFAGAAFEHYANASSFIIFETTNEPNGMGHESALNLTNLAKGSAAAMRAQGLAYTFVGPATAGMDFPYIQGVFELGILDAYSRVSVHPYRSGAPESALADYQTLRGLIQQYAAPGKQEMPIYSGEWGWTTAELPCSYGNRVSESTQAKYVARMFIMNAAVGVNVSIAYDWKDDGLNASNCEDNFGSVRIPPVSNSSSAGGGPFTPPLSTLVLLPLLFPLLLSFSFSFSLLLL
jgi:hypothetical protein